jgi:hypothetical protein
MNIEGVDILVTHMATAIKRRSALNELFVLRSRA